MTRVKAFQGVSEHLTTSVNDWLLENGKDIVILNLLHSATERQLTLVIVYEASDEVFEKIKDK